MAPTEQKKEKKNKEEHYSIVYVGTIPNISRTIVTAEESADSLAPWILNRIQRLPNGAQFAVHLQPLPEALLGVCVRLDAASDLKQAKVFVATAVLHPTDKRLHRMVEATGWYVLNQQSPLITIPLPVKRTRDELEPFIDSTKNEMTIAVQITASDVDA